MSRKDRRSNQESRPVVDAVSQQQVEAKNPLTEESIGHHRRCPICWGARRGYGVCYSNQRGVRYYKCIRTLNDQQSPCGHTWTATVQLIVHRIEHRVVDIDSQR